MALELPASASEIEATIRNYVQSSLTGSNPFSNNHWLGAEIRGISEVLFDTNLQLNFSIDQNFPNKAIGIYLARWLTIFKISQLAATQASGTIVVSGSEIGKTIVSDTAFVNEDGGTYKSTLGQNIADDAQTVDSIKRSGQVATVSFASAHGLATGIEVNITGSTESEYNVSDQVITVISATEYTFVVIGSPNDDESGSIASTSRIARVPIISDESNSDTNVVAGGIINLQSPVATIDTVTRVDFGAISGGTDEEADADTRLRLIERIQNPVANFNEADITTLAKTVNGVTRVFVQTPSTASRSVEVTLTRMDDGSDSNVAALATISSGTFPFISGQPITVTGTIEPFNVSDVICILTTTTNLIYSVTNTGNDPLGGAATMSGSDVPLGTCKVFFMRDNDEGNGIPNAAEITAVNEILLSILPANTSKKDFIVNAPTPKEVPFTFTELLPNTKTMQEAIINSLEQMFVDRTTVGVNIASSIINNAIESTTDPVTGKRVAVQVLSTPTEIAIASNEIGVLGVVTFP